MHALLIKTEWSSCSSAMDTSWGVLLWALGKRYLLVQANSSWDPPLIVGSNLGFLRKCPLRLQVSWPWRWHIRPTEKTWYRWQRQTSTVYLSAGDRMVQPTLAEMWRWLTSREMCSGKKDKQSKNKWLYLISDVLDRLWFFFFFGLTKLLWTIVLMCHHWCTWQEINAMKEKCEKWKEMGNRNC